MTQSVISVVRQRHSSGDGYLDSITKGLLNRKYCDKCVLPIWLQKLPFVYIEYRAQSDGTVCQRSKIILHEDAVNAGIREDEDLEYDGQTARLTK